MLVVTPGEPAGIGPDLVLLMAARARSVALVAAADVGMLRDRASALGLRIRFDDHLDEPACEPGTLTVAHMPLARKVVPGVLATANVAGVMQALDWAIAGCLDGRFEALVTGPMQKSIVNDAGLDFTGHTEYLAAATGAADVVMLLVAGNFRVALATTHLPLAAVPRAITPALLTRRLQILHAGLIDTFAIGEPRILVAGLNPHAGEDGHLGCEEIETIGPVCKALRSQGFDLVGPLPADTLFTPLHLQHADAVMAMYHDQGLPVLKYAGFGRAVNVTLGLPFLRTSVDHGTALDKAATGEIDSGSFAAAVELAGSLSGAVKEH